MPGWSGSAVERSGEDRTLVQARRDARRMRWCCRECHDDDLEAVVRLLEATRAHQASMFTLAEVIASLRDDQPAIVATRDEEFSRS